MKILWGSPLPPIRSGVSDYAVELLAELGSRAEVRVLEPPQWSRPEDWPLDGLVEMVPGGTGVAPGELALIHIGNNPHHLWLARRLAGLPRAVVVLHDLVLHHLLVELAAAEGRPGRLEDLLRMAHGGPGAALAQARELGISGRRDPFLFPARRALLASAAGVVVHSKHARAVIERENPGLACRSVPLAVADPGAVDRAAARARLGISDGDVVLMHLGFLTPEKGLQKILAGVAGAIAVGVPARLLLVGEGRGLDELRSAADAVGIADRVETVGWLPPDLFAAAPAAADLGVVLRTPSAGETSAAALRFMACGTPVAVGGGPQFLEWPEAAAPRLTPGAPAAADLARLLGAAAAGGPGWARRRSAARAAYAAGHRPEHCAAALLDALSTLPLEPRRPASDS